MNQSKLKKIESLLPRAMGADRYAIRREIGRIKQAGAKPVSEEKIKNRIHRLEKKIDASMKRRRRRKDNRPELTCNPDLPITNKKNDIIEAISKNRVVIISGETGSGKTTQIPKFCLAAGRGIDGKIGCTQPRRIAAINVARRISEELGRPLGQTVGYKIRFADKIGPHAYIKIMTDGILLAETQGDPYLNEYDTLIVDEAHERSLNIDFVLGILKNLIRKRKDLKLIITSATIDTEKFSKAFDNAPVIEVSGRMYPVEVLYSSPEAKPEESDEQTHVEMAVQAVDQLQSKNPYGDILVFMPTEQDIRETCELIEGRGYRGVTILPLFARLSADAQAKVFSRPAGRKIIVATNVAETSLTIPGIKYVVDTGLARISQYTPRSRITSLPVKPVSKSSADQRKGRCGRVENGVCIRLFSEDDYTTRPLYTLPEILRSNLAEVILRMIALNLGDISEFPFIDRPSPQHIQDGFDLLFELGAIKKTGVEGSGIRGKGKGHRKEHKIKLTETGKLMAKVPIDPRLSRILIEAQKEDCLREVLVIASALSIQDPRERPAEKQDQADQAHAAFQDPASDFITLLNIWNRYHHIRQKKKTTGSLKRFCKASFLSFKRMREWRDIHAQITSILQEHGLEVLKQKKQKEPSDSEAFSPGYTVIHKSVLSGFLANIAAKKEKNIFNAAKGKEVMLFPGSGLFNRSGSWIVAAEMVETSRLFARTAANIDAGWLEALGKDRCKYTYLHPHWERNRGEVTASEQVSLYGLIIVPERSVSYGRIDPEEASDIFIRSALVDGDVKKPLPFMKHNRKQIDSVREMENKIRRRDLLVSEQDLFQFYRSKLSGIYDIRTLEHLIRKKGTDRFLRMRQEDLFRYSPNEQELSLFPDRLSFGGRKYECDYRFDPGKEDDGLTIKIPSALAPTVSPESLDWLVPGLLQEKITALIRGLPKEYRKQLVPVADTVAVIVREMPKKKSSLITALGKFIHQRFKVDIPASAWPIDLLQDHLKTRVSITGPRGEDLCSGRDKNLLHRYVTDEAPPDELEAARKQWEKTGITSWDFNDLPETITIKGKDRRKWFVYPGLETKKGNVNLRLFLDGNKAVQSHQDGVAELFAVYFSKDLKFLKKHLALPKKMHPQADYFGGIKKVEKRVYQKVTNNLFCKNIRSQKAFYARAESVAPLLLTSGRELLEHVTHVLEAYHAARSKIYALETANRTNATAAKFLEQLREEVARLVPENFIDLYSPDRLDHLMRYLKAIALRAQRGLVDFEKDQAKAREVAVFNESLNELLKGLSASATEEKRKAVENYFWLIEEYKVSVFAQELKTAVPVSKKRLEKKLKEIERMV